MGHAIVVILNEACKILANKWLSCIVLCVGLNFLGYSKGISESRSNGACVLESPIEGYQETMPKFSTIPWNSIVPFILIVLEEDHIP